jgi:hypothetical protein
MFKSGCMGLTEDVASEKRLGQGWGLFESDCREGAVFSRFIDGGNPWPQADARGTAGGGRTPPSINRRKDQPGRLGTKEKVPALSRSVCPMQTFLNVTKVLPVLDAAK